MWSFLNGHPIFVFYWNRICDSCLVCDQYVEHSPGLGFTHEYHGSGRNNLLYVDVRFDGKPTFVEHFRHAAFDLAF